MTHNRDKAEGQAMSAKTARKRPPEQFLGEIETEIVGLQYYGGRVTPGEQVNLERERENRHDRSAIRVENGLFQTAGYVARHTSSWLAPLIDSGKVRVEGYIPTSEEAVSGRSGKHRLALMVFLSPKGESILASGPIETKHDTLHALALWVYGDARSLTDPQLIAGLAEGLEPLLRQDLLPESKLLLSLVPGMAREIRATRGMQAQVTLKAALEQLVIGQPLDYDGFTLFPLSWPQRQEPACALLSRAVQSGTAVVEEISPPGGASQLRVHNKGLRPLLIPEGEILVGTKQNRVVNAILMAAKTSFTLPTGSTEQGRWQYRSDKQLANHQPARRPGDAWWHVGAGVEPPLPEEAAGVVIGRNGKILHLDLFDAPAILAELWPRLGETCFGGGLPRGEASRPVLPEQVRQFLNNIVDHARPSRAALGLGQGLEIAGGGLTGTVVLYADRICHVKAFIKTP